MIRITIYSRTIWERNQQKVHEHNLQADVGIYTYWLGMNRYADLVNFLMIDLKNSFFHVFLVFKIDCR